MRLSKPNIGSKFNKLTVIAVNGQMITVKCDCGSPEKQVRLTYLVRGIVKACGCLKPKGRPISHGMCDTKIYSTWKNMLNRVFSKSYPQYERYSKLGVCEDWKVFENFYRDVGDIPSGDMSLDRINNDVGYFPGNVRWATRKEQQNNRSNTVFLSFNGEVKSVKNWSELLGISPETISSRLKKGLQIQDVLSITKLPQRPAIREPKRVFSNGTETVSFSELAKRLKISKSTLHYRADKKTKLEGFVEIKEASFV